MRRRIPCVALLLILAAGCVSARTRGELDELRQDVARNAAEAPPQRSEDVDALLAATTRVDDVVRIALARSPRLRGGRARVAARIEEAGSASRLPDPQLQGQIWGAPLVRPYAAWESDALMLGVRQELPAMGTALDARARTSLFEAATQSAILQADEAQLTADARRAYAAYAAATRHVETHRAHVALLHEMVELARQAYQAGRGRQEDVLRLSVSLARAHTELFRYDADLQTSRAYLNALMARPPQAPLGPPAEDDVVAGTADLATLERELAAARPEIRAAQAAVEASESRRDVVADESSWPSLMLGADYMYMPMRTDATQHAYGVMVGLSLPWLNPGRADEVRAAERNVDADVAALEETRIAGLYELHAALARERAARNTLRVLEQEVGPQAEAALDAGRASFAAGTSDAVSLLATASALLEVRLEIITAKARLAEAVADVRRAVGTKAERKNTRSEP